MVNEPIGHGDIRVRYKKCLMECMEFCVVSRSRGGCTARLLRIPTRFFVLAVAVGVRCPRWCAGGGSQCFDEKESLESEEEKKSGEKVGLGWIACLRVDILSTIGGSWWMGGEWYLVYFRASLHSLNML